MTQVETTLRGPSGFSLARQALVEMEAAGVWPTPLNFELWLHYLGAPDSPLGAEMKRLIEDAELRRAMGAVGRRIAVTEFALAGVIERTLGIYRLLQANIPVEVASEPAMLAANSPTVAPMNRSRA